MKEQFISQVKKVAKKAWQWDSDKKFYKNPRFWTIVVIVLILLPGGSTSSETTSNSSTPTPTVVLTAEQQQKAKEASELKSKQDAERKAAEEAEAAKQAEIKANTISNSEYPDLANKTKEVTKTVLKAPSTAEFQGGWLDPLSGWEVYSIGDSAVRLTSVVDSQNSFGAMIRSSFSATYCKKDSKYTLTLYVFDGQQMHQQACGT